MKIFDESNNEVIEAINKDLDSCDVTMTEEMAMYIGLGIGLDDVRFRRKYKAVAASNKMVLFYKEDADDLSKCPITWRCPKRSLQLKRASLDYLSKLAWIKVPVILGSGRGIRGVAFSSLPLGTVWVRNSNDGFKRSFRLDGRSVAGSGCVAVSIRRLLASLPHASKEWPVWVRCAMSPKESMGSQPEMLVIEPASGKWMVAMSTVPLTNLKNRGYIK